MKITKKILSVILMISLLFVVLQTSVSATDFDIDKFLNENGNMTTIEETNSTNNTNTTTTNNVTNITNTNNVTNNTQVNETLPKTGITEDYAIIAFAIICGISAIYAYRKVKNYNIK